MAKSATKKVTVSSLEEQIKQPTDDSQSSDFGEIQPVPEKRIDAFTDLDPLGTGKSKPYIDKKYFFQDLKNPPKKVLKDLTEHEIGFSANFTALASDGGSSEEQSSKDPITNLEASSLLEGNNKSSELQSGRGGVPGFVANFTKNDSFPMPQQSIFKMDLDKHKTDDPIIGNNKALLVTDNDPFSPRMKKFDPFEDDFSKSPIDPFEFNFAPKTKITTLPDTKIVSDDVAKIRIDRRIADFNGPLQVNLPPENYSAYMAHRGVERHSSDASDSSLARNRPNVFKQNTVDVISSISSKKMKPHLFSQKYSKRDSNSINMRRLQESDSLSENETAPEPPPRPDSTSHAEPPPLPPKKQFSDIVIRPSPLSINRDTTRYDYIAQHRKNQHNDQNSPALPLPLRKVTRTDSSFPGPGRPAKKVKDEDEYLTPISSKNDMPILQPPPQRGSTKNRGRRHPEPVTAVASKTSVKPEKSIDISLPDITLSQLLTLGIDDLAAKLKVPANKLSTMNIVELTKYLSEFIEKSSQKSIPPPDPPVQKPQSEALFKVSFDDSNDQTFVAKFDDNFGDDNNCFVPNFDNFNEKAAVVQTANTHSADRYAVFRIMDQELKSQEDDEPQNDNTSSSSDNDSNEDAAIPKTVVAMPRIDTKITQAISQAKDRYAALRDIILVEDLFDKPSPPLQKEEDDDGDLADNSGMNDDSDNKATDNESSPEINISINLDEENDALSDLKPSPSPILGSKDDLEIDEYMNRAISNLSLDSRDHLSPSISKSPVTKSQNASTSPIRPQKQQQILSQITQQTPSLNDVSTSPIPIQKSPISMEMMSKSPLSKPTLDGSSNNSISPIPMAQGAESMKSATDTVFTSSPEATQTGKFFKLIFDVNQPIKPNIQTPNQYQSLLNLGRFSTQYLSHLRILQSNHQRSKVVSYECYNAGIVLNIFNFVQNQLKTIQSNRPAHLMRKANGKRSKNITRDGHAVTHHLLHVTLVLGMMTVNKLNAVVDYIPIDMDSICDMHEECIQVTMTTNMRRKWRKAIVRSDQKAAQCHEIGTISIPAKHKIGTIQIIITVGHRKMKMRVVNEGVEASNGVAMKGVHMDHRMKSERLMTTEKITRCTIRRNIIETTIVLRMNMTIMVMQIARVLTMMITILEVKVEKTMKNSSRDLSAELNEIPKNISTKLIREVLIVRAVSPMIVPVVVGKVLVAVICMEVLTVVKISENGTHQLKRYEVYEKDRNKDPTKTMNRIRKVML